jgi:nitrite reductase (NO-forming)
MFEKLKEEINMNKISLIIFVIGLSLIVGCTQQPVAQPETSLNMPVPGNENVQEIVVVEDLPVEPTMEEPEPTTEPIIESEITPEPEQEEPEETVKEFTMDASNFKYSVKNIEVNQGDRVKIKITNVEGTHDFVLDELNVDSGLLPRNQEQTIEFVADKKGSYEYYCSVGKHRELGMWGTITIK